jgi:predicted DNA-binding ribbon-helix-helix protein
MPSNLGQMGGVHENAFWIGLKEIVRERHMTLSELVAEIDAQRHFRARLLSNPTFPR